MAPIHTYLDAKGWHCPDHSRGFVNQEALASHFEQHSSHQGTYCAHCQELFANTTQLWDHRLRWHAGHWPIGSESPHCVHSSRRASKSAHSATSGGSRSSSYGRLSCNQPLIPCATEFDPKQEMARRIRYKINGTGIVPFKPTPDVDAVNNTALLFQTITRQPPYRELSFEELRLADYAAGRRYCDNLDLVVKTLESCRLSTTVFPRRNTPAPRLAPIVPSIAMLNTSRTWAKEIDKGISQLPSCTQSQVDSDTSDRAENINFFFASAGKQQLLENRNFESCPRFKAEGNSHTSQLRKSNKKQAQTRSKVSGFTQQAFGIQDNMLFCPENAMRVPFERLMSVTRQKSFENLAATSFNHKKIESGKRKSERKWEEALERQEAPANPTTSNSGSNPQHASMVAVYDKNVSSESLLESETHETPPSQPSAMPPKLESCWSECGQRFGSISSLLRHLESRECHMKAVTLIDMNKTVAALDCWHLVIHGRFLIDFEEGVDMDASYRGNAYPFLCPMCSHAFKRISGLVAHVEEEVCEVSISFEKGPVGKLLDAVRYRSGHGLL